MADFLSTAGTAAEAIAFGSDGAAHLPQLPPETVKGQRGYDGLIDAVNRLPRPIAACLALALFLDAAIEPAAFEARMQALSAIPQPLWLPCLSIPLRLRASTKSLPRRDDIF